MLYRRQFVNNRVIPPLAEANDDMHSDDEDDDVHRPLLHEELHQEGLPHRVITTKRLFYLFVGLTAFPAWIIVIIYFSITAPIILPENGDLTVNNTPPFTDW